MDTQIVEECETDPIAWRYVPKNSADIDEDILGKYNPSSEIDIHSVRPALSKWFRFGEKMHFDRGPLRIGNGLPRCSQKTKPEAIFPPGRAALLVPSMNSQLTKPKLADALFFVILPSSIVSVPHLRERACCSDGGALLEDTGIADIS